MKLHEREREREIRLFLIIACKKVLKKGSAFSKMTIINRKSLKLFYSTIWPKGGKSLDSLPFMEIGSLCRPCELSLLRMTSNTLNSFPKILF